MTIQVFVLNVEEFLPLVEHAKVRDDVTVEGPAANGYFRLKATGKLQLNRKALAFKPAVWHGLLTGGYVGKITHFDNDDLTLEEASS